MSMWRIFSQGANSEDQEDIAVVNEEHYELVLSTIRKASWWKWDFHVYALETTLNQPHIGETK